VPLKGTLSSSSGPDRKKSGTPKSAAPSGPVVAASARAISRTSATGDVARRQNDLARATMASAAALSEQITSLNQAEAYLGTLEMGDVVRELSPEVVAARTASESFQGRLRGPWVGKLRESFSSAPSALAPAGTRKQLEEWFRTSAERLNTLASEMKENPKNTWRAWSIWTALAALVLFGALSKNFGFGFIGAAVVGVAVGIGVYQVQVRQPAELAHEAGALNARMKPAWYALRNRILEDLQANKRDTAEAGRAELRNLEAKWQGLSREIDVAHPSWSSSYWNDHELPEDVPDGVRLGTIRLPHEAAKFEMQIVWPFPAGRSLMFVSEGSGASLPGIVARLLATMPAGKAEFELIDPLGLGETFRSFAHLSEYGPSLLGEHVLTQQKDISDAIGRAAEHIEAVNSRYLKGTYRTIEEHNAEAGEVAVPYRFLVVQDFPKGFSDEAIDRLSTVAQKGPACGTYVLVAWNRSVSAPYGSDTSRLASACIVFSQDSVPAYGSALTLQAGVSALTPINSPLQGLSVVLDAPPTMEVGDRAEDTMFGRILARAGKGARAARDVALTADLVVDQLAQQMDRDPDRFIGFPTLPNLESGDRWWSGDSSDGLVIPLGKAGAAGIQNLVLRGERAHVLMAGGTGQGKSTLIRTLITTATATYSPEELRLYLIDFKDGVGFKQFATPPHALPHAEMVAIKSQREFGVSVLESLVAEMERRAEAQKAETERRGKPIDNLGDYRRATGLVVPRIMVIVDEFQSLFTPEGRIADRAADLVVDLARKGRSFGIHFFFSTQALHGARLPIDAAEQMMVRIAFRLSAGESEKILTEGNTAAASIGEVGVAIYNGDLGSVAANQSFRVALYPDELASTVLKRSSEQGVKRNLGGPPRVFGGDEVAHLERSNAVRTLLGWSTSAAAVEGTPARSGGLRSSLKSSINVTPSTPRAGLRGSMDSGNARQGVSEDRELGARDSNAGALQIVKSFRGFVGEPLSLNPTVEMEFRRTSGRNVLSVGGDGSLAIGMFAGFAIGYLEAMSGRSFPSDLKTSGLAVLAYEGDTGYTELTSVVGAADGAIELRESRRECAAYLCNLVEVVRARQRDGAIEADPILLYIHGLDAARDLRMTDRYIDPADLPSLSEAERSRPALAEILRDGPEVGVHVVAWSETYSSMRRVLDTGLMEEFEYRLVHRVSESDSEDLLSSDLAAKGAALAVWMGDRGRLTPVMPFICPDKVNVELLLTAARG